MKESAYKQAGVDIEAGADLVERIKPHVKKTHRSGVMGDIGGFGALFDLKETKYKDPVLVSGTDGVGTKLKIAIAMNKHDTVGIDLVAMCVNDLIVQGAEPLFFLDYFASGKLNVETGENVVKGIAAGCEEAGCALIGGETAEMPSMYADGDYDLAGFCVGAVERDEIITGETIKPGDVILSLSSNGLHSNGFSLVRKIAESTQGYGYENTSPFESGKTFGESLLTPTRIYVKPVLKALELKDEKGVSQIKGLVNITGGGLTENIPRILPKGLSAVLDAKSWPLHPVFAWLFETGNLSFEDAIQTLNCGVGMIVICDRAHAENLCESFKNSGEGVHIIGKIEEGAKPVILHNMEASWKRN